MPETAGSVRIRQGREGRILVRTPAYDARRVARLRSIAGRRWDAAEDAWSFPDEPGSLDRVLSALSHEPLGMARELLRTALDRGRLPLGTLRETLTAAADRELGRRGLPRRTRRRTLGHLRRFLRAFADHPGLPGERAIRAHLDDLRRRRPPSGRYVRRRAGAVAFLYAEVLGRADPGIRRARGRPADCGGGDPDVRGPRPDGTGVDDGDRGRA